MKAVWSKDPWTWCHELTKIRKDKKAVLRWKSNKRPNLTKIPIPRSCSLTSIGEKAMWFSNSPWQSAASTQSNRLHFSLWRVMLNFSQNSSTLAKSRHSSSLSVISWPLGVTSQAIVPLWNAGRAASNLSAKELVSPSSNNRPLTTLGWVRTGNCKKRTLARIDAIYKSSRQNKIQRMCSKPVGRLGLW